MPSHSVRSAVESELSGMPDELSESSTAAAALALADSIDLGTDAYRFQSALVGQLRECMNELRAKAPAKVEGDRVDELNAKRAARRGAASTG